MHGSRLLAVFSATVATVCTLALGLTLTAAPGPERSLRAAATAPVPAPSGAAAPRAAGTLSATPPGEGTAVSSTSSTGIEPSGTPRPLRFAWSVRRVTASELGSSWRRGCPVRPRALRAVSLTFHDFQGRVRTGTLVLHADVVDDARRVFATMFDEGFPLRRVRPVTAYRSDDDASMAADNTSAFNCRRVTGGTGWSRHAYGRAIDVNPVENPMVIGRRVLPPSGSRFTARQKARPGVIRRGDAIHTAIVRAGFRWGGDFRDPDYQHLER